MCSPWRPYSFGTLIPPRASLEARDCFITWTVKYFFLLNSGLWFLWLKCSSSSVLFAFNQYYVSRTTSMSILRRNSQTWLMSLLPYTSPFVRLSFQWKAHTTSSHIPTFHWPELIHMAHLLQWRLEIRVFLCIQKESEMGFESISLLLPHVAWEVSYPRWQPPLIAGVR